ncbi:uncharacterized protein SEPMUDRAFT_105263 [Sphaerulina musiva SO2202]|uniref:Uncharacterized protein n=1 Tax=Sphaerulina musiva (strain SO2202) TaxID=692275 RepID=M3B5A3_SPHMS|nr:uncharacterized protein SEPMUDRAFT_105263 [Sphaerulina musiva SO2202]EMF14942.1 hypothetical protein SEPMUDRAFT_105263 [Sphaerulina musiva SO2202]
MIAIGGLARFSSWRRPFAICYDQARSCAQKKSAKYVRQRNTRELVPSPPHRILHYICLGVLDYAAIGPETERNLPRSRRMSTYYSCHLPSSSRNQLSVRSDNHDPQVPSHAHLPIFGVDTGW